jgi:hypothetical protein
MGEGGGGERLSVYLEIEAYAGQALLLIQSCDNVLYLLSQIKEDKKNEERNTHGRDIEGKRLP